MTLPTVTQLVSGQARFLYQSVVRTHTSLFYPLNKSLGWLFQNAVGGKGLMTADLMTRAGGWPFHQGSLCEGANN